VSSVRKTVLRRERDRERALAILKTLSEGNGDAYMCYRELYGLWVSNNTAMLELRPLFRMADIDPDGALSVTDSFKTEIRSLAVQILPLISASKRHTT
jgi:hypothetical protein